ncbi:MAG: hypothetical protein C5B55_14910 [Blastocatellia bacterium]|nr:MAG: hypothetical protein C5B55_14910 [Blastocatellia bacterium]
MSTQIVPNDELLLQQLLTQSNDSTPIIGLSEELKGRLQREIKVALENVGEEVDLEFARTVFEEMLRVFDRLALIELNLQKLDTLMENLSILDVLQFELRYLIDFIEARIKVPEAFSPRLHEVLDGISYGISHDVKRIFERELTSDIRHQSTPVVYGKIMHAHGLLANCFQQSFITLAQVLNPKIDPLSVFDDFEVRLRQSLILCNDLALLIRVVKTAQTENSATALKDLVEQAIKFRDGSMHYLMYRDWRGYEKLALALITAIESDLDHRDLLHQFGTYLEVVYGHVKLRAVFKDMFPSSNSPAEDVAEVN